MDEKYRSKSCDWKWQVDIINLCIEDYNSLPLTQLENIPIAKNLNCQ
jgi:hypothetical protein